jgi:phage terminase large subunit-like protein
MSKTFRPWSLDQALLLPPSVRDFVPAGHLSRFVVALVTEEDPTCAIPRGTTYDNQANLAKSFFEKTVTRYEGTRLGRQGRKSWAITRTRWGITACWTGCG